MPRLPSRRRPSTQPRRWARAVAITGTLDTLLPTHFSGSGRRAITTPRSSTRVTAVPGGIPVRAARFDSGAIPRAAKIRALDWRRRGSMGTAATTPGSPEIRPTW